MFDIVIFHVTSLMLYVYTGGIPTAMKTMMDAIRSGSVLRVMYAMSLKAQANCFDPATLESPLHLAVELRQANIFGFLLLVRKSL